MKQLWLLCCLAWLKVVCKIDFAVILCIEWKSSRNGMLYQTNALNQRAIMADLGRQRCHTNNKLGSWALGVGGLALAYWSHRTFTGIRSRELLLC